MRQIFECGKMRRWVIALLGAGAGLSAISPPSRAQLAETGGRTLIDMSLEELTEVEVFSPSRYPERTIDVASAVHVITREDLRRSAVTTVPDALRLVPGVQVGRVDANKWAVSMRGFNSREANKLLVLVDGRSIYDPLFSGMLWESHDFLLEDIERIEVIRGPGGTLWGANAFNGVINIITRDAQSTQGTFASLTVGDEERYIASVRQGWQVNDRQHARVYARARERDSGYLEDLPAADDSRDARAGFRWDWRNESRDQVLVSGDVFDATAGVRESAALAHDVQHRGRNLLARWTRQTTRDRNMRLQIYFDHVDYDSIGFAQERDSYDLEFQQTLRPGPRQRIVWGGGYRLMRDTARSKIGFVDVLPEARDDEIETVFAQNTITLAPDRLDLSVGLKYEATDYADEEWLPSLRLAFTPTFDSAWWGSISEAIRVPSRLEADLTFGPTFRIGDEFGAEHVRAYEAGHRRLVQPRLWYDVAVFYNDYENLRTTEGDGRLRNLMQGATRGIEAAVRWESLSRLRLDWAYTYLDMDLELDPLSTANSGLVALHEGLAPRHQLTMRALLELGRDLDLDATVRRVDDLPPIDVPAYTQLDLALTWRPAFAWEIALVGWNLLDSRQPEQDFAFSTGGVRTQVERSLYLTFDWRR